MQPNRALARRCRLCGTALGENPEWPVYRHDPALGAFSSAPLDFDSIPPAQPLERLWAQVNLGEEVAAPPVLDHGLLVVCSRKGAVYVLNRFTGARLADLRMGGSDCFAMISGRMLVAGSGDRVVAYDLLDSFRHWNAGRFRLVERWRRTLGSGPIAHPFNDVAGEALLACAAAGDGMAVHCLDLESGEPRWASPARIPAETSALAVVAPAASPETAPASSATMASSESTDGRGFAYALGGDQKIYRIAVDSGAVEPSRPAGSRLRVDVAPAWLDSTLFFFDEEGALHACRTDTGQEMASFRLSDQMLLGVKGFAVSPRGILAAYGRGLARLSLGGQLLWRSEPSIESVSSSPVLAGDCGMGVGQNRSIVFLCDFKETFWRFHQFLAGEDANWAAPAFAGRVLYTCSRRGELNALKVNALKGNTASSS